jgi:CheY-like chemotaxis protein
LTAVQSQNELSAGSNLPIRILMVDDNPRFLKIVGQFLAGESYLQVVGVAVSGREALNQITLLQPDLVLMDVTLPDFNGLDLTRHLKAQPNAPRIIIVTAHTGPEYQAAAEQVKADGFITKDKLVAQLQPLVYTLFNLPTIT